MADIRAIPTLLLKGDGLYKGVKFGDFRYVGDPINAVRIFNEKKVDELVFLDITATRENRRLNPELIQRIADECYMPFAFGGGIKTIEDIRLVLRAGAEKAIINSAAVACPDLINEASLNFGAQSLVISIDVRKKWFGGYDIWTHSGTVKTDLEPSAWAREVANRGAGEILITSIDRDGTREGYDVNLIRLITEAVNIPVIACGGAGEIEHFRQAVNAGASAVAAGSMFVFYGKHKAVLISYTDKTEF